MSIPQVLPICRDPHRVPQHWKQAKTEVEGHLLGGGSLFVWEACPYWSSVFSTHSVLQLYCKEKEPSGSFQNLQNFLELSPALQLQAVSFPPKLPPPGAFWGAFKGVSRMKSEQERETGYEGPSLVRLL